MKKSKYLFIIILALSLFLFFGCTKTSMEEEINLGPSEVSGADSLNPETPAYAVEIVTDEEFVSLIEELSSIFDSTETSSYSLTSSENVSKISPYSNSYGNLINILDIIKGKNNLINKMKQFRTGVNKLLKYKNRHNYMIEIKGNAKTSIENVLKKIKGLSSDVSSDKLYMDFRDIMLINLFMEPFIFAYDNHDALINIIETASNTANSSSTILRNDALEILTSIETLIAYPNFDNPDFYNQLKNYFDSLSDIAPDENFLDMNDIFKENSFTIPWISNFIHLSDLLVKTIVEINTYEILQTDNYGFRNDEKTTLWTFGESKENNNVAITLDWYNVSLIESDLPEEVSITLNDLNISNSTQVIDFLKILDNSLPNKLLNLNIEYATNTTILSTNIEINARLSLNVDFEKLSNTTNLDLKDNNLKINDKILEFLNESSITEFIGIIENIDKLVNYINFFVDNLEFVSFSYDKDQKITTLTFDYNIQNKAISLSIDLSLKGLSIKEIIDLIKYVYFY